MAESFLFGLAGQILGKLASVALKQMGLVAGVDHDLKKLEETLCCIKALLLDAEEKQSTNHQLRLWLERLEDIFYDAENVLDEFIYEALHQQLLDRANLKAKVRHFFTHLSVKFRLDMANKVKNIRGRVVDIETCMAQFHLTTRDVDRHVMMRDFTHSFVRPSDVIGRETDRKTIIQLLTRNNVDSNFDVVSIVGIGGLGKTAIAKLVYNDSIVDECFPLKIWICVSDDFDLQKLISNIIKVATKDDDCRDIPIDLLQARLRDTLKDIKFLLVLDDVWNDDPEKWKAFQELLMDGANGSKILATTRSHLVASSMGIKQPYILEGLPDQDCWTLFAKCAFREGQEKDYPNLIKVGKEIIKKCAGVPLAVRSLGSMLFMKTDEQSWLSVKESEMWRLEERATGILPALKLSYVQLPSYLKQCFAFCSIFPKDHKFTNWKLIQMWMSQGYISENEELEKMGQRYINELFSRCFFQDLVQTGPLMQFKMHDLVHDLALQVSKNECYTINDLSTFPKNFGRFRHVSVYDTEIPTIKLDLPNLRSFYFPNRGVKRAGESFYRSCIARFKFLRMLDLTYSSFVIFPDSVGSLNHLRYLDISHNRLVKNLPNAICKLLHLQTLKLIGCLKLEGLPKDIGNLICLRTLYVTAKKIYLMPNREIGLLQSLRFLHISECPSLITSNEPIESLTHLQTLILNTCSSLESWPGNMKHLPALEELVIWNCDKLNVMEFDDESFKSLQVVHFGELPQLKTLPRWLNGVSNTLRDLCITSCARLTELPEWLEKLTTIQKLKIEHCRQISGMPEGLRNLTSLRELHISSCVRLISNCKSGDGNKISHISEIFFDGKRYTSIEDS